MSYESHGNLYYWTLGVKDKMKAQPFFGRLLNWEFDGSGDPANIRCAGGLQEGSEGFTFYFWVDDVEAAVQRVRQLGGQTQGKQTGRSGDWAECVDPNGVHVSIGRLSPEFESTLHEPGTGGSELSYFVVPAPDLEVGKAFYAGLLGWEFDPGERYAHCSNVHPAGGLNRQDGDRPLAWFRVDDIQAAVTMVREVGGHAEDPSQSESGWSAACIDDQSTHFNLWQPEMGL